MRLLRLWGLVGLGLAIAACQQDPPSNVDPPLTDGCRSCHGSNANPAPPRALDGVTDTSAPNVGAHQAHLMGARLGRPVACSECHLVPENVGAPGHNDTPLPAELIFGALARHDDSAAAWDRATLTCQNTYCHGATLEGGAQRTPIWNVVDGTQSACGSCHGMPPPLPHPPGDNCEQCHAPVAGPNHTLVDRLRHADGVLDVKDTATCVACHGSLANAAPPNDLAGQLDASLVTVGAHQSHLAGGAVSRAVACGECHLEPATLEAPGHIDTPPPAELIFGALASQGGVTPVWARDTATCANTYCHGATTQPKWTLTDGSQAACGSCHGLPPAAPHPANDRCELCHLPTAGPNKTIAHPENHVDGVLQVAIDGCTGCHGTGANLAPPTDTQMRSDPSLPSVGAHQTHLTGGRTGLPVACDACHLVPLQLDSPGHIDTALPAELRFGSISANDNASPSYDGSANTCANTYCHGANTTPKWTITDGTEAACGTCHGLPPAAPHPANERCELCHLPTAGPNKTIAHRESHVNGVLDVAIDGCTGCHGTAENLAPPVDTMGRADPAVLSIGAHQTHLAGGRGSRPVPCDSCHLVPTGVDDPGHRDTGPPAELRFSGLARADGATPQELPDGTCANTYCHGSTLTGGTHVDPSWIVTDGSEAACGSCHGLPPPLPHPANDNCGSCHAPTAGVGLVIANPATHVDGVLQVTTGDCMSCHGGNGISAPPMDTNGQFDLSLPSVGAHRAHVEGTLGISRPVACDQCHVVPTELNSPGHVDTPLPAELNFGNLATAGGAVNPVFDPATNSCANTYCHGGTLDDGSNRAPIWTLVDGTQAACGSCHGIPPAGGHPTDNRCELCHQPTAGPNLTIADATTHVDGILQASAGCDSCHGQNGNTAPPRDLDGNSATNLRTVGAHQLHLSGGNSSRPVACTECHLVPAQTDSPGHIDTARPAEVIFGNTAGLNHSPRWTAGTCANTYCHGGNGGRASTPNWTVVNGSQGQCDSCHGNPPPSPVHQTTAACANCHLPTAGPGDTIANRNTHVDGVLQVVALACNTCHGDQFSSAPPMDLSMQTGEADPQVGTHQAHLSGGQWSAPVACTGCHIVPPAVESPGHIDAALPAEVIFSGRASAQQSTPIYDGLVRTCADSYCHGGSTSLGSVPLPVWNDPGSVPCGGCHGLPPAAPHPQMDKCELCHAPVAGPNLTIAVPSRHVDGVEDTRVPTTCQSCHGTANNPAPPPDLAGNNGGPMVGAHLAHLNGTGRSAPLECSECHLPVSASNVSAAGHFDSAEPAELIFGALARQGGRTVSYATGTCGNTYCHDGGLPGGTQPNPNWTQGALACDACHGMPPPDTNHTGVPNNTCSGCHPDTSGPGQTIAHPERHVDGVVQTSATCDSCHGQNGDPTPPRDIAGLQTSAAIGAHQAHRTPSMSAPVACNTCHLVPDNYSDPGHADTPLPAEVTLIGRARLDGVNPSYASGSKTCNNSYCHGASLTGGKTSVVWSDNDGSESQCGACHGMPPASPAHNGQTPTGCNNCHLETAGPNATIIAPSLHLDGTVQVSGGGCDTCHGSPPAPGRESYAGSAGAHQAHAGTLGFECRACHGNNGDGPTHNQGNGTVSRNSVDLVFNVGISYPGGTSMRNGGTASYDRNAKTCAVGCHNPILGNPPETPNLSNRPVWAAGALTCSNCHDAVATTAPRNHDLTGLGSAGCLECHDQSQHLSGTMRIRDPDTTDSFVWSASQPDNLCRTCHDSGTTRAFGNQVPRNVQTPYAASAHAGEGYRCTQCHSVHSSTGGPLFVDPSSGSCMTSGCHNNLTATFALAPGGVVSHHRIEGGAGVQITCSGCHNAHVSQAPPNAPVDPDNRWVIMAQPTTARTQKKNQGNYTTFCLRCHDGSPPPGIQGALNIATALSSSVDPSAFRKNATESWHKKEHSGYNCQNCHDDHGSNGTGGIQRGRLLLSYITINNFNATARTYSDSKGNCTTRTSGQGFGFGCH